ncbi:hypothetical protein [Hymenobacter jejuensis]|uniref:Uncharacterized protein n=1 Tax=Hymenobacter jejuensis TaxID=2502781 RepID=A0A5B7ZYU6_9BACT|nr:hypothetical protein [Hymenobacter jejuensis]QDA59012.1 hypothetical protein FHG12_02350 [Hymenobacter jejuensis]
MPGWLAFLGDATGLKITGKQKALLAAGLLAVTGAALYLSARQHQQELTLCKSLVAQGDSLTAVATTRLTALQPDEALPLVQ